MVTELKAILAEFESSTVREPDRPCSEEEEEEEGGRRMTISSGHSQVSIVLCHRNGQW